MSAAEQKYYSFQNAAHWHAGVADLLEISDEGLISSGSLDVDTLEEIAKDKPVMAIDHDGCDSIFWVTSELDLYRQINGVTYLVGKLSTVGFTEYGQPLFPLALLVDHYQIILLTQNTDGQKQIFIYARDNLELLDEMENPRDILHICKDGKGGFWMAVGGDTQSAELIRHNGHGNPIHTIQYHSPLDEARLAITADQYLVVLDISHPYSTCATLPRWQISVVHSCKTEVSSDNVIYAHPHEELFSPDFMVVHQGTSIALASANGEIWLMNTEGEITAKFFDVFPAANLPIQALAANSFFYVAAHKVVFRLTRNTLTKVSNEHVPTYLSPVMVSPEGLPSGWLRADLNVVLPPDTAIEISAAYVKQQDPILNQYYTTINDETLTEPQKAKALNQLLPWDNQLVRVYRGKNCSPRTLNYPIHSIKDTHLWLRIRIRNAEDQPAPSIRRLKVIYPNVSLLQNLPAVYQQDQEKLPFLRNLLAVLESMHDDLDTRLNELPKHIDPNAAPNEWIPFLLRWLGLPPATELDITYQRILLKKAPALLKQRGTYGGLAQLLKIFVKDQYSIADLGAGSRPWVLPVKKEAKNACGKTINDYSTPTAFDSQLGCQTLIVTPPNATGFALGCQSQLGEHTLGENPIDPLEGFSRLTGKINIYIGHQAGDQQLLTALLHRYLRFFIPAHCQYQLIFISDPQLSGIRFFDDRLHVEDYPKLTLGQSATLGNMPLVKREDITHSNHTRGIILGPVTSIDSSLIL